MTTATEPKPSPNANLDAEVSVLGVALVDRDALQIVVDLLTPGDFYLPCHQVIWRAIQGLHAAQDPADLVTVSNFLRRAELLDDIGGAAYLAELANAVHTSANVEHHAQLIKGQANARRLGRAFQEGIAGLKGGSAPGDVAARVRLLLDDPQIVADQVQFEDAATAQIPDADWLIDGHIARDSLSMLYGDKNCGKTFLALRMALSVAHGWHWRFDGHRHKPAGTVLYVAAESGVGVLRRLAIWGQHVGEPMDEGRIHVYRKRLALADQFEVLRFIGGMRRLPEMPAMVIVDTFAMCIGGVDENSAQETGRALDGLKAIQESTGAAVLFLHHTVKANAGAYRGSSAIGAAVDTELCLKREESGSGIRVLSCTKQRDQDPFGDSSWEVLKVGGSAVMVPSGGISAAETALRTLTPKQSRILQFVQSRPDGVTHAEIIAGTGAARSSVYDTVEKLQDIGVVGFNAAVKKLYYTSVGVSVDSDRQRPTTTDNPAPVSVGLDPISNRHDRISIAGITDAHSSVGVSVGQTDNDRQTDNLASRAPGLSVPLSPEGGRGPTAAGAPPGDSQNVSTDGEPPIPEWWSGSPGLTTTPENPSQKPTEEDL